MFLCAVNEHLHFKQFFHRSVTYIIKYFTGLYTEMRETVHKVNIIFFLNFEGNGRILSHVYSTQHFANLKTFILNELNYNSIHS